MKWSGRFHGYTPASFRKDLTSGLIVGIIAIPLGMAFAIASGVKPEYGLYTTIVAGILISLFGGSRFQIGGPTGAFIPILFAIVMEYGYENLLIAGFLAGILLVMLGIFKLGELIKFIPRPVTIGFTAGIAVIIFSGQIANFLGLNGIEKHEQFLANMKEIIVHLDTVHLYSLLTALVCFVFLLLTPKVMPKVPGSLVGLLASTAAAMLFFNGHVATIGSAFGDIPSTLPQFHIPEITWGKLVLMLQPALVIAMLGSIESLLSAVVADGMTGKPHSSNRELIGQGIANIVTPFFGGIPATGAIARTATNIRNGAVSPVSGVVHGAVVLLILLLFAPFASEIPLAGMAPILMLVAWNMSERKAFKRILETKTGDSFILLVTFFATILANLTIAVGIGLLLAVLLFVKKMSDTWRVSSSVPEPASNTDSSIIAAVQNYPQLRICTFEGPLFFGSAYKLSATIPDPWSSPCQVLLLQLANVPYIDTTGASSLSHIVSRFHTKGGLVVISGIQQQPLDVLKKTRLHQRIGAANFFHHTGEAIQYVLFHLDMDSRDETPYRKSSNP
ncbi:SulP family sulfate permease [Paenibacillus phyllosphaerae]|uniref:SulP family sulfate permease n=1 Tax=Paenibacillus phyllosphaerae TaxID=274593 RepID=A0A7W5AYX4_9BACL|nr:sulfate permease [Paenibacillus phyllosphaerae]MBB3111167.1 SulP family sulfate permease [Paenibacillus phyllosphaerae]